MQQSPLQVVTDIFICPLLLFLAAVDLLPNPARYLMRRAVRGPSAQFRPLHRPSRRLLLMAIDETSHEAVDWAVTRMLDPSKDYVSLVYIPEGDFARSTYQKSMHFNRSNYLEVLEGVDFLWESCEKLDLSGIDFDCFVMVKPADPKMDVSSMILNKSEALKPDLVLMGASKRAGPEDVGQTAYRVSIGSAVPVVVVK